MSKESTFFEIHRIKRDRVMLHADMGEMTPEDAKAFIEKMPWEINPGNPLFQYNVSKRIKENDIKRRQVMVVSTPGNGGLERLIARSKEVGSFEVVPVEWPLPSVDHALDALRRTVQVTGISPELLAAVANTETGFANEVTNTNDLLRESVAAFSKRWADHMCFTSKPQLSQAMFARDIRLIMVKDVLGKKSSFVPANGSMRQRKRHHHAALIMKQIEYGKQILKDVYPTHIGEMKEQPDGTVQLDVVFKQAQSMDLTIDRNTTFAPRGFQNEDGSINIDSFSIVNRL